MSRFTIDVGDKFDAILTDLARSDETTKAEIIRRAVAVYSRLKTETSGTLRIAIVDQDDKVKKEIVIP